MREIPFVGAISPELQRFTLRRVWRTISIIDSQGFELSSVRFKLAADAEPVERERLLDAFAQRAGGPG